MYKYRRKEYIKKNKKKRRFIILLFIGLPLIIFTIEMTKLNKEAIFNAQGEKMNIVSREELDENINSSISSSSSKINIKNDVINILNETGDTSSILNNLDNYPDYILELILKNPETIGYVKDYPKNYPAKGNGSQINISHDYIKGQIPLFLQWDKRWGYYNYGNYPIALNGCGPTALSMVIVGLTGDITKNPKTVADISYEQGYLVKDKGSSWTLMSEGVDLFGLNSKELPLSETIIRGSLKKGHPIIACMGPGDFTTTGHYIVLTGITEDGKILINDPNSKNRSNMKWNIDVLMEQTKNLWAFSN